MKTDVSMKPLKGSVTVKGRGGATEHKELEEGKQSGDLVLDSPNLQTLTLISS